jgi:hypothetical protein
MIDKLKGLNIADKWSLYHSGNWNEMYTEVQIILGSNLQTKRKAQGMWHRIPRDFICTKGRITSENTLHRECMAPENLYKVYIVCGYLPMLVENPANMLFTSIPHRNHRSQRVT